MVGTLKSKCNRSEQIKNQLNKILVFQQNKISGIKIGGDPWT